MAIIWTIVVLIVAVLFLIAVVRWYRRPEPSTSVDVTPSQPPADAEAEGMRVVEPGEIAPGSGQHSD